MIPARGPQTKFWGNPDRQAIGSWARRSILLARAYKFSLGKFSLGIFAWELSLGNYQKQCQKHEGGG